MMMDGRTLKRHQPCASLATGWGRTLAFLAGLAALLVPFYSGMAAPLALPDEQYRTIRTEHFRIHYPSDRRDVALVVAKMAEDIHQRLEPRYRSGAYETHLVLIFRSDLINAYTTVYGMDRILLYMASPPADDFARYRDWIEQLLVHEYVHILTLRPYAGFWNTTLRLITGVPPNLLVATGLAEAYTVGEESYDGTGRLQDPRTLATRDILASGGRFPSLEEAMTGTRYWPYGATPYLFGGRFLAFVRSSCGDQAVNDFFLSRIPAIFPSWRLSSAGCGSIDVLYEKYRTAERLDVLRHQKGLSAEGVSPRQRLTYDGGLKRHIVLNEHGVFYFAAPEGRSPGIYMLDARDPTVAARSSLLYRARDVTGFYLDGTVPVTSEPDIILEDSVIRNVLRRDGRRIYDDTARRESPAAAMRFKSDRGGDAEGRPYAYILRQEPYTYLMQGPAERVLLRLPESSWMGQPAVLPGSDGQPERIVVVIRQAGRVDHSLVGCESGVCRELLSVPGTMATPSFTADGRVLFSSDVGGVSDIYSVDRSGSVRRLTHSLTGFAHPVLGDDGLYVIGTGTNGHDVYRIGLDAIGNESTGSLFRAGKERSWLPDMPGCQPAKTGDCTPVAQAVGQDAYEWHDPASPSLYRLKPGADVSVPSEPYSGLLSFKPFLNGIVSGPLSYLNLGVSGYDPLAYHELSAGIGQYDSERGYGFLSYAYRRFRPDFVLSVVGTPLDRSPPDDCRRLVGAFRDYCQGERRFGFQQATGGMDLVVFGRLLRNHFSLTANRTLYRNASQNFSGTFRHENMDLGSVTGAMDLSYFESNPRSISPERGFSVSASAEEILPGVSHAYGDQGKILPLHYERYMGSLSLYLPFFFDYHVPVVQAYTSYIAGHNADFEQTQLSMVLPGFATGTAGRAITAYWLEYRFPIWQSRSRVLPWFPSLGLRYIALAPFAATGQARNVYEEIDPAQWKNTAGLRMTVGMYAFYQPLEFQITYAHGTGPYGEGQVSFGFSVGAQPSRNGARDALRRSHPLYPDGSYSNR